MECYDKKMSSKVTLNLKGHRIEVNKDTLKRNSLYFTALFSENFSDHRFKEFPINYDISIGTLENYINWVENTYSQDDTTTNICMEVEPCLEQFTQDDSGLLDLLNLSIVFMSEKLTKHLTQIIILYWLRPEKLLDIWILSQTIGLDLLRDVVYEACLDRFSDLPLEGLMELSLENLVKLIGNVNINCAGTRIKFIAQESIKKNRDSSDYDPSNHLFRFLTKMSENSLTKCSILNTRPKHVQCVVALKCDNVRGKVPCVYWFREKVFTELVDLKNIMDVLDNGKEVFGRQIIGRRFSIYVIGGEQGLGSGRFIKTIWRYCLLSSTWFPVAELPRPRRHMAVEFIKNNLYLIGGVGHHRVKLASVDVLNMHTKLWSRIRDIPEMFTEVPASCVINNKLMYHKTNFYVYDAKSNAWNTIEMTNNQPGAIVNYKIDSMIARNDSECCLDDNVYIGVVESDTLSRTLLSRFYLGSNTFRQNHLIHTWSNKYYRQIFDGSTLTSFSYKYGRVIVERGVAQNINTYNNVGTYAQSIEDMHESGFENRLGCFNIIDPALLHKQVAFSDEESIDV